MSARLLSLYATTPIHAGIGSDGVSVIDLPIQREAHTGWPCIFGSAVKGALRAWCERTAAEQVAVDILFGPESTGAGEHAGAMAFGDARLLLFPIRSLTGYYKWIVSPALLARLKLDCDRANIEVPDVPIESLLQQGQGISAEGGEIFLDVYRVETEKSPHFEGIVDWLAKFNANRNALEQRLVVVDDDLFTYLVQQTTPVTAHNRLDTQTKTVARGALWYEETLPAETVLYTVVQPFGSRKKGHDLDAEAIWDQFKTAVDDRFVQFGGNETVGMGFCKVQEVQA